MRTAILCITIFVLGVVGTIQAKEDCLQNGCIGFIENKGQIKYSSGKVAEDILFMFEGKGMKIYIKRNSISYELYSIVNSRQSPVDSRQSKDERRMGNDEFGMRTDINFNKSEVRSHRVDIEFANSSSSPQIAADGCSNEYYNFYTSEGEGITNVRKYQKIKVIDIYPGIDVVYYFDKVNANIGTGKNLNKFKYDFIVKPGADPNNIQMFYRGSEGLNLNDEGNIIIETTQGKLTERIPLAYSKSTVGSGQLTVDSGQLTVDSGQLTEVNAKYKLSADVIGFEIGDYDRTKELVIDPELFWGTYFGGDKYDYFTNVALDSRDNIYAVGYTESTSNIATTGAYQQTYAGGWDAVLAKFDNQGRMVWATYYGGNDQESGLSVVVNYEDKAFISGFTASTSSIATTGAYQETYGGGVLDGFIAKFSSTGSRDWGTYYGGSEVDVIYSMALDSSKNLIIGGRTQSENDIASSNGLQTYKEGWIDGFVVKFDSSMNRTWGTYIGGNDETGSESVTGVAADRSGNIIVTGFTPCDYSIANDNGHQPDYGGGDYDAFIIKFYPSGSMHWGSYYGGSDEDFGRSVATYGNGNIYLLGNTKSYNNISSNFAHQERFGGFRDAFLVKFNTYGERLWGTYYGGSADDVGRAVSKYGFDAVVIFGFTQSTSDIATPGETQTSLGGLEDAFAARFSTNGDRKWGTYYGGAQTEISEYGGISYDKKGNIVIAASTQSNAGISTPATNPHQPDYIGDVTSSVDEKTGQLIYTYKEDAFLIMIGTRIVIDNVDSSFCQGSDITVPFTIGLDFNTNNLFTLQLSDKNGNFANPTNIGTLSNYTSASIQGTIPVNTEAGTGYRIRITGSSPSNISDDNGFDIAVNALPNPQISGESDVCSRNTYTYQVDTTSGFENIWLVTNGKIIGDSTATFVNIKWEDFATGKMKIIQTAIATGCVDSAEKTVDIVISPDPIINGENSVSSYSEMSYSTLTSSNLNFEWEVTGGTISGLNNTNRVVVNWGGPGIGSVKIKLTDKKTACSDTLQINITINSSPLTIQGKKKVCANSNEKYSVITPSTSKNLWKFTGGEIIGSDSDSTVNVLWSSATEGFVRLIQTDTLTNKKDTVVQRIEIIPVPESKFYGLDEFCEGTSTWYIAVNSVNRTNKWFVYNGQIIGDDNKDSVFVKWNNIDPDVDSLIVAGSVSLMQTDLATGCSYTNVSTTGLGKNPLATFVGDTSVCSGRVESYSVKDHYTLINRWTISGGTILGIAEDTTIQVEWGTQGSGKIKLFQVGASTCEDSSETLVIINSVPVKPTITASGKDLLSSSETGNQWFYNSEKIENATNKSITPDKTGYYTLQVTNQEGCESDFSQPYYFEISKVNELLLKGLGINIFPNPADNFINIDCSESLLSVNNIKLFNTVGIIYFNNDNIEKKLIKIDMSKFPVGMYILEIKSGAKVYFSKVVKE